MRKIGFTGTRTWLPIVQQGALRNVMIAKGKCELTHGDCIGADEIAHGIAKSLGWRIVIRPASGMGHLRAYCKGADEVHEPKPPLDRNTDIVNETDELIGCPKGPEEQRSGTWSTIRKARRAHKKGGLITLIMPSGGVVYEAPGVEDLV